MLYIFHVDKGRMMHYEMNIALSKVLELKKKICDDLKIPVEKQVLLISGGLALSNDEFVCHYNGGTDTNPIFLFDLLSIEKFEKYEDDNTDLEAEQAEIKALETHVKEQVELSIRQLPCANTVHNRAAIAQDIYEWSRGQLNCATTIVMHQHLQQQGWGAVVANLEDILISLSKQAENFNHLMEEYLKVREEKMALFEKIESDVEMLKKIPLLPTTQDCSLQHCKVYLGSRDNLAEKMSDSKRDQRTDVDFEGQEESSKMATIYDWMKVGDRLQDYVEKIKARVLAMSPQFYKQYVTEFEGIYAEVKPEFKEIKGLGDRLSQLDTLLRDGNKLVEEQKVLAESFLHTKTRYGSARDDSVYQNLCENQVLHFRKMLNNFLKIADIHKRCSRAKCELSLNIVSRLRWILYIEGKVNDTTNRIELYMGTLRQMWWNLKILEQIHNAPKLYFSAISEVIRRQKFSKKYTHWTSLLSAESKEIYEREVHLRREFASQLASHFLSPLFPGLDKDILPAFATEKPKEFDEKLPQLTQQSLNILRESVPELSHILNVEDPIAIPSIVEAGLRSNDNTNTLTPSSHGKEIASTEFFSSAVTSSMRGSLILTSEKIDDRSGSPRKVQHSSRPSSLTRDQPESETDTEEFEKVCGSISDGTYSPLLECVSDTKSAKTKHSLPSQVSDSKHIKLDSSHRANEMFETTIRLEPGNTAHKKTPSPSDVLSSPASHLSPEEFESPDYYIDESMPSSYTESACTTTTTSSSTNRHHHPHAHRTVPVKSHHVITAELQKQIDEKNVTLLTLQNELGNSRTQIEALQLRLNSLATMNYKTVLKDLRQEMEKLKDKVRDDETTYINYIAEVSAKIVEVLEKIHKESEASQSLAVASALTVAQLEEDKRRNTLQAQLNDTCRELEIYQAQTREYITQIDRLKAYLKEERAQLNAENNETIKKLTLEHELEMEALKELWAKDEKTRVDEVSALRDNVNLLEQHLSRVQLEKENLNKSVEEKYELKYREKEESIRQILGATYIEHEKKSLEFQKQELEKAFNNERLRLLELHQNELKIKIEEINTSFQMETEKRLATEQEEAEKRHLEELQKCRDLWEAQKEEEVETKKEELKAQLKTEYDQKLETAKLHYKMDLEGLRSRFRMMTTASMDKSPSETSLEKFERGDFVETTYHDVVVKLREELLEEKDKALDELRKSLEERHAVTLQEERDSNEEKRREEIRRLETEKQEILKEISHDKERVIEDLRLRVEFLTDETEKLRKCNARAQEEARALALQPSMQEWQGQCQCELYKKEIDRLNKEVQRAKRLSFVSEKHPDLFPEECSASSPSVSSDVHMEDTMQKLQLENRDLRNALARTCSDRKLVSLDDAQVHDIVLIVWDDDFMQYRILLETNPILHFLHSDSYAALGLSKGSGKPEKTYLTAQVLKKKEFCQAKRDGNRFRVPRGTKFYRVEAGPITFSKVPRPESACMLRKAPSEKDPSIEEGPPAELVDSKSSSVPSM